MNIKNNQIDEKKICFIICANDNMFLEESIFYISQLEIPEGFFIDIISIAEASCMAAGYNEGMRASNAKYKVYLHQDVFIIYKGFLQAMLDIFNSDNSIGMIGMVGAPKISPTGVMWYGNREGALYGVTRVGQDYSTYRYSLSDGLYNVDAIDGFIMITSYDIYWREDLFDGWDFYDVSQSFEFRKAGYKVVVPEQISAWCIHECGIVNNLKNYNKYRKKCMKEYTEFF